MAEVVALAASIVAICQASDRIIVLCKFYIGTVHDAPSDLRKILVEISALSTIIENLEFLKSCDSKLPAVLESMTGSDGAIGACHQAIVDLEKLLPQKLITTHSAPSEEVASKKRKIDYKAALTALAWPLRAGKVMRLLQDISMYKTTISLALTVDSSNDIKAIKKCTGEILSILTDAQRHEVFEWLEVTDPSPIHHRACSQYEHGTGNWILRSPKWDDWMDHKHRCLWIHGIPGAGKTVLASYLIGNIESHCKALLRKRSTSIYYYCYFGHNQDETSPFLRWVLNRLCREVEAVPNRIYEMFKHGGTPSLIDLLDALESILSTSFDTVYITVDAVDESSPRDNLLRLLRDLATDARFEKVQLLVTSRQYLDIERVMEEVASELSMSNPLVDEDIRTYVKSQLHALPKFKRWPPNLLVEAEQALMSKAKGMFRWAVCQIDVLQRLKPESCSIMNALANLPKTLDETYRRIFLDISDDDRTFVHHVLKWIYFYNVQTISYLTDNLSESILLRASELSSSQSSNGGRDFLYDGEALRELCGCLIVVRKETLDDVEDMAVNTVAFAHYTVLEYLQSTRISTSHVAFFKIEEESTIADCFQFTLMQTLKCKELDSEEFIGLHSITNYCVFTATHIMDRWPDYLNGRDDLVSLVFEVMNPSKPHYKSFITYMDAMYSYGILDSLSHLDKVFQTDTEWVVLPANINLAILYGLGSFNSAKFWFSKIIKTINMENLFCEEVIINQFLPFDLDKFPKGFQIKGSILDLIAQLSGFRENFEVLLNVLLDHEGEIFQSTSSVLLSYIVSHPVACFGPANDHADETCTLFRLLQLEVHPDAPSYKVKPLQIAVVFSDVAAVKILLQAGADPNGSGNENGMGWEDGEFLALLNHLAGYSPLHISRKFTLMSWYDAGLRGDEERDMIRELLVAKGARSFKEDWACGDEDSSWVEQRKPWEESSDEDSN